MVSICFAEFGSRVSRDSSDPKRAPQFQSGWAKNLIIGWQSERRFSLLEFDYF